MKSPRQINFGRFSDICQSQITDREWMTQWPGEVDFKQVAELLRPLAMDFRKEESMTDEQVLAVFFSDQAIAYLKCLRNTHCFWVIAQEAAKNIADDQYTIGLPAVLEAMEAKPEIPKSLVV